MKKVILLLIVLLLSIIDSTGICQEIRNINKTDSLYLINIPQLPVPEQYKGPNSKLLPFKLDNSELPYLRASFNQYDYSCGQASSIGYNFTYEINRVRDLPALDSLNLYAPLYTWNFFNNAQTEIGVNFYYSFEAIKANGQPNIIDFGGMGNNRSTWMSGYEKYHNSMFNRISKVYSIYVGDMEGIQTLKHWLYDHLNGSEHGSLANFYTDHSTADHTFLPEETPEAGKHVITRWGTYNGHSLTIVGWNDSIRFDYNDDGQYTTELDINDDGIVDLKDCEIGGFKFINSFGPGYGNDGFKYLMYKSLADEKPPAGIWNKSVYVFDVKEDYEPLLTYKVKLKHTSRDKLKIVAGISSDTTDFWPEHELEFPIFNYQGGDNFMQGQSNQSEYKTIEIGLDVSPLISYINSDNPYKFFLKVIEKDPNVIGSGEIIHFSVMDYLNDPLEIQCSDSIVRIIGNGTTILDIVHSINMEKVQITTEQLPPLEPGEVYNYQLEAAGGYSPYTWDIFMDYNENNLILNYPNIQGEVLNDHLKPGSYVIKPIEFSFPFYGQFFDTIILHTDGILIFDTLRLPIPYQVNDLIPYKLIKMIAPFLSQDLVLKQSSGNEIIYEGNEEYAAFRWKESYKIENDYFPVDFTCILHKDGSIEYYYNSIDLPDRAIWLTGISNGDNINFSLSDYSKQTALKTTNSIQYIPQNFVSDIQINDQGILSVKTEDEQKIYEVAIRATDDRWISSEKTFQLSSGINYDYSIHSGNDSQIDYGETAYINISITNITGMPLNNVLFSIQNSDPMINLIDDTENIGSLNPGETSIIYDAFSFEVSDQIPNEYNFKLRTFINSETLNWEGQMKFEAYAPELNLLTPIFIENINGRPDPGDTVKIVIRVSNDNGSPIENVSGELVTSHPYITFIDSNILNFGDLPKNSISKDTITIYISENASDSQYANLEISVFNPDLDLLNESYQMLIGRYPILIINKEPNPISADSLAYYFDHLNMLYHSSYSFDSDLLLYHAIFLCLGKKFSSYTLSEDEGETLTNYLNSGGRLYMEGGVTWSDDPQTIVHSMFNLDIDPFDWNLIDTIAGVSGTFAEDCRFYYSGFNPYYNHSLIPIAPAFPLLKRYGNEHIFSVAYENDIYKTIGSNINFGRFSIEEEDSSKMKLMEEILVFFDVIDTTNTFIAQYSKINLSILNCFPNPASNILNINFQLSDHETSSLVLYDILGNKVSEIFSDRALKQGKHSIRYNCAHLQHGIYICHLYSDKVKVYRKIVIK